MNNRLQEFDIIRVIATFTVIAIHVTASYVLVSPVGYLANQLARFAVPLFIIMSGFLLQYVDLKGSALSAVNFYRKRFDRILWPYLLWSLFYVALTGVLSGQIMGNMKALPSHILWGTGYYHLYFVIIIIQLYLLYPLLRRFLVTNPQWLLLITFGITFISQTLLYLSMLHKLSLPAGYDMIYLVCFPVWIFYFVLGMFIALKKDQWQAALRNHTSLLGFLWLLSFILLMADSHYTSSYGASIRPSVMMYTVSTFFFFYVLAMHYRGDLPRWVSWVANQSFLIFLMHPVFLTALVYGAIKIGLPNLWAGTLGMLAQYLSVCLLTLFASYILSLTPLAEKLGGLHRH